MRPRARGPGRARNLTGATLIRPGGREAYAGFWIRDLALSLGCGLIRREELEHAILVTVQHQAREDTATASGSLIPRWSIPDHVTLEGTPIFFPGTDIPAEQGQPYGYLPSLDSAFFLIGMVWHFLQSRGPAALLAQPASGIPLMERLDRAFQVVPWDEASGLVYCDEDHRGVSFGFTDTVVHSGFLLFASLLRARAAGQLAAIHDLVGDTGSAHALRGVAAGIRESIVSVFQRSDGMLRASTGRSSQPDVWGSAFAVSEDLLGTTAGLAVAEALRSEYHKGTISWKGNIRHVPTGGDFGRSTAWESTVGDAPLNRYQNGSYWGTPVGWVCSALGRVEKGASVDLVAQYLEELMEGDFRKGEGFGSPYECLHPAGNYRRNPVYMTSVTAPLAEFVRCGWVECAPDGV